MKAFVVWTVCWLGIQPLATAQVRVGALFAPHGEAYFGRAIDGERDVDADGHQDLIVGGSFADVFGKSKFCVRVYSGRNAQELFLLAGDNLSDDFGFSLTSLADVDGDGHAEIVVGDRWAPNAGPGKGRVWVYSGRTRMPLWAADGLKQYDLFSSSVDDVSDLDGDGADDVVVGSSVGGALGYARVFSGRTGALLFHVVGATPGDVFGSSVAGIGDFNRDGYGDFAAGAPLASGNGQYCGRVRVFDGRTGVKVYEWFGAGSHDHMARVAAAGDVDADGHDDVLVVSAGVDSPSAPGCGAVRVFSGHDGSLLHLIYGTAAGTHYGAGTRSLGDVDGDALPDFVVSAPLEINADGTFGTVRVYSGATAALLTTLHGEGTGQGFAYGTGGVGDLNADGRADLLLPVQPISSPSSVVVYTSLLAEGPTGYCTAKPNSKGCTPSLRFEGAPTTVYNFHPLSVVAEELIADEHGLLFWGLAPDNTPFLGGTSCVGPPRVRTSLAPTGGSSSSTACTGSLRFTFTDSYMIERGIGLGMTVYAQFLYRDLLHPDGTATGLTSALRFTVLP